jgi:hypothetical protein
MQQAPSYNEPEQVRRDYVPQQQYSPQTPAGAGTGGAAVTGERRIAPLSWTDWVRWGPIWAGFFTILSTLAIIGSLGTAIGVSVWHASIPSAFSYGWFIMTGIIAYLLGGYVTSRASGVAGLGAAILNGGLAWALSLVALIVLVLIGAGNIIGIFGYNLAVILRGGAAGPGITPGNIATTAWVTFASLVIGLILAIIGAIAGMRALSMRGRTI